MRLTRRGFVSMLAVGAAPGRAAPQRKALFICMDGCDPRYLAASEVPNLKRMMKLGLYREVQSMIPSVTNINNSSIATASWPDEHGITGNYYWDRTTRRGAYMESPDFLRRPTVFERAKAQGWSTAFVCSKHKLLELLRKDADVAFSAEKPPEEMQRLIGPKADVYSAELNYWAFRAVRHLLRQQSNFVYLSTTDYMMHTYAPESAQSLEHMHEVDRLLGAIAGDHSNIEIYFTADHSMNAKPSAIDLGRVLRRQGVAAEVVPVIKDRYVAHHGNLGGSCYVYLEQPEEAEKAADHIRALAGVEHVFFRADAAQKFRLQADRIGDLVVFGEIDTCFGDLELEREPTKVRTHGSLHESTVPLICFGRHVNPEDYKYNFDITRRFAWQA